MRNIRYCLMILQNGNATMDVHEKCYLNVRIKHNRTLS